MYSFFLSHCDVSNILCSSIFKKTFSWINDATINRYLYVHFVFFHSSRMVKNLKRMVLFVLISFIRMRYIDRIKYIERFKFSIVGKQIFFSLQVRKGFNYFSFGLTFLSNASAMWYQSWAENRLIVLLLTKTIDLLCMYVCVCWFNVFQQFLHLTHKSHENQCHHELDLYKHLLYKSGFDIKWMKPQILPLSPDNAKK